MSVKSDIETIKNELMSLRTLGIMSGSKHIEAKGDSGLAALDRIAASHEELCTALGKITVGCEGNVYTPREIIDAKAALARAREER